MELKIQNYQLLEDNIGENEHDSVYAYVFLDKTPEGWSMENDNKLHFITVKLFCFAKENDKRTKRQTPTGKNMQKTNQ